MDEPYAILTVISCAKQTQENVQTAATTKPSSCNAQPSGKK